jgi:hypothetical protein
MTALDSVGMDHDRLFSEENSKAWSISNSLYDVTAPNPVGFLLTT